MELEPLEAKSGKAPNLRVVSGQLEVGAAWRKVGRSGRHYILVELDDPTFAQPIYARLIQVEDS